MSLKGPAPNRFQPLAFEEHTEQSAFEEHTEQATCMGDIGAYHTINWSISHLHLPCGLAALDNLVQEINWSYLQY